MAGDWIPMRTTLRDDPRVMLVARELEICRDHLVGLLHYFWSWASDHTADGLLSRTDRDIIDAQVGHDGFTCALERVGWVSETPDGVLVEDFETWLSKGAKRRLQAAKRKKRERERVSRTERDESVTIGEDRREEKREKKTPLKPPQGGARSRPLPLWEGQIPDTLQTPTFETAWSEWLAFRKDEKRKPVTQRSGDMALKALASMGPARAVAAIEYTIANGWQGIREADPPKRGRAELPTHHPTADEVQARARADADRRRKAKDAKRAREVRRAESA